MLTRILLVVIVVPVAVILIALAVANRAAVPFTLDPFNPGNPALTIQMPFFIYLFLALILGVLIGGFAAWLRQASYRRLARQRGQEVETLRTSEARQSEAVVPPQPAAEGTALIRPAP
ncbi:LapA family protein [Tianweitania sediminis]|jgi:uncharacterized integral membrane protein|uniref:LapA family protein n=1 Tax=Tianweitania sediminis TaxID=1502156 RepID=A0A8J7RMH5_9HYPH|nr:LapA family protein [Tianweitania sediminis]MBP0441086.1 LapA family protein [Tianweitania sediminis]HEV7416907.1 LapA family protein [Tianweitania sediminis]